MKPARVVNFSLALILFLAGFTCVPVQAATFVIANADSAGEGFNDPNAPAHANQIGNNPGATLGQLRLNLFNAAALVWGGLLSSNITITVSAQFNALTCSQFSGQLGSAGATGSAAGFSGGLPSVAYHIALAESLANSNINNSTAEINATFNSSVDTNNVNCLGGGGFYYGLDGNAPAGTVDLFPVVLHELAHGLGFTSMADVNPSGGTGNFTGSGGFPDTFSRNLLDLETGKSWDAMTAGERLASALNDPDLVWKGAQVTANRDQFLGPAPEIVINAPGGIVGTHQSVLGDEPTIVMPGGGVTAFMADGTGLVANPCADVPAGVTGKILLYDSPVGCTPALVAYLAQLGLAVGVIIANTSASGLPNMAGQVSNQAVTIPYVGATQAVGGSLRTNIVTANTTIRNSASVLNGDNQGKLRMYAPSTFAPGSSVAHWASEARPDLLMERSKGLIAFNQVDLTTSAFADMGWVLLGGDPEVIFEDGFEN
jgi:hypothetical protein